MLYIVCGSLYMSCYQAIMTALVRVCSSNYVYVVDVDVYGRASIALLPTAGSGAISSQASRALVVLDSALSTRMSPTLVVSAPNCRIGSFAARWCFSRRECAQLVSHSLLSRLRVWQLNACDKYMAIEGDENDRRRKRIRMVMEVMR